MRRLRYAHHGRRTFGARSAPYELGGAGEVEAAGVEDLLQGDLPHGHRQYLRRGIQPAQDRRQLLALASPLASWKSYPFEVRARQDAWGFHVELRVEVGYSSTCPCSASLARQLIRQRFAQDFAALPLCPARATLVHRSAIIGFSAEEPPGPWSSASRICSAT